MTREDMLRTACWVAAGVSLAGLVLLLVYAPVMP